MKTSHCHHNIDLCLRCIPQNCHRNTQHISTNSQMEQLTKKYALLMETQLSKLSEAKEQQIDELNQTISQLKMTITKLQVRNGLDRNSEKELREKMRHQDDRIRALQNEIFELENTNVNKKQVIKQVVKEVIVKVPVNTGINKQELDNLYAENAQLKACLQEKQIIYGQKNDQFLRQLNESNKKVQDLTQNISNLEELLSIRNMQIDKLRRDNKYQEERIQILAKPHVRNIEPVIITKIDHSSPQIQTIYVDRPVLQTQFVEIEKVVNRFIQPQRPVINRIIECEREQRNIRKVEDEQQIIHQQQIGFDQVSKKYQDVINSYQRQRQDLVKKIQQRDHDYHLLTKKVQLCQKLNNNRGNIRSSVDVDVTVIKDQPIESQVRNNGKYGNAAVSNMKKGNNIKK